MCENRTLNLSLQLSEIKKDAASSFGVANGLAGEPACVGLLSLGYSLSVMMQVVYVSLQDNVQQDRDGCSLFRAELKEPHSDVCWVTPVV